MCVLIGRFMVRITSIDLNGERDREKETKTSEKETGTEGETGAESNRSPSRFI